MTITLAQAKSQLNIDPADSSADTELQLYVDAGNEWVAEKVTDTSPAPVKLATLLLIDHLWTTQRSPTTSPLDTADTVSPGGLIEAIPDRVSGLLAPFITAQTPSYDFPDVVDWPDPIAT